MSAAKKTGTKKAAKAARPIEHVVIIVKENHGFDNYFGSFPGVEGATLPRAPNPPTQDPNHTHGAWLTRATTAVREQFVEQDIPAYFAYARKFTLCDHYFSEVAGPSTPNHLMLITADSPIIVNPPRYRLAPGEALFDLPSLPVALENKGLSWHNYGGYAFDFIKALQSKPKYKSEQFALDAAKGKLPSVSWVYAPHALSEHAPDPSDAGTPVGNVTLGSQWTVDQVNAVVRGGLWPKTAIFITWDDWGGWLDHVDPPNVEQWKHDPQHPDRDSGHAKWDGTQFRYGSRVGCLVVSPYAKSGHVSKAVYSHVSLLKFCENLFGLPHLNARDAKANAMSDCFDFARKPAPPPPPSPGSA